MEQVRRFQTRRELIRSAAGAAGFAVVAPLLRASGVQTQTPALPGVETLGSSLFVLRRPGEANVIIRTDREGFILVDGGSAAGAEGLLSFLMKAIPRDVSAQNAGAAAFGGPVHTLFNTHWHPEQTGLNEQVGKAGGTIIAQENTRLWLTQNVVWPYDNRRVNKLPKMAQPNKTFYEKGKLDNGSGIEYGYIADAPHTDGDMWVYFPAENVLAVGDAVSGEGWADLDWWTGGWIGGMVGGLQRIQTLIDANTRIVPSRGPILKATDIRTQLDMYSAIYDRLSGMMNKGRSPKDAVEAKPTKEYDARMGNPDKFIVRAFESLWAYLSPDA